MGKRVEDYVMRIPTLDKNICKKIVNTINKYDWYKHEFVAKAKK